MKNRKIKNYFISPAFQLTLIITTIILMTATFAIIYYQINSSFDLMFEIGRRIKLAPTSAYFKLINHQQEMIKSNFLMAISVCYALSVAFMIYVSHKLAGPIYRLKQFFKGIIEESNNQPLTFRKYDFNQELPSLINQAIEKIKITERQK